MAFVCPYRPPGHHVDGRNLRQPQRDQMAALVRIAPTYEQSLHLAFQFVDRRCFRSPYDVEGHGLMRVATKAFDFEVPTFA